ncbi:MAG: DUF4367 domain-containing protein [Ruminococcaceae bacterium]|nr:DUF4367 domain-containing protein [Oscillospiraceae bacterium]
MNGNRYEKIDHLIAIAASGYLQKEANRFESLDTSAVQFDATYYRKRAWVIRKYRHRPMLQKMKRLAVRVAVALLVLILLAALAVGCIPAVREAVFKAFVEWQDDHFKVSFQPNNGNDPGLTPPAQTDAGTALPTDTSAEPSDTSVSDVPDTSVTEPPATELPKPPTQIEVKRKPTALPQGVYEDVVRDGRANFIIDYYLNEEYILSYSQGLIERQQGYGDITAIITDVSVSNHEGILIEYQNNSVKIIEWTDGEYRYQIMSEVYGKDQLIALAESVR